MPLIILDRDGVINEDSDAFIKNVDEWLPIAGSIPAIGRLSKAGYTVVIATNQSGLSRGLFGLDELEAMHQKMRDLVAAEGGRIDGIFYCPHLPAEACHCRKPSTGLYEEIAQQFNANLHNVPVVGDSLRDLQAAIACGCKPLLVRTGKGAACELLLLEPANAALRDVRVFNDLASIVDYLLQSAAPVGP